MLVKMVKMKLKTNTSVCLVDVVNSHEGGEGRGTLTLTFLKMHLSFFD